MSFSHTVLYCPLVGSLVYTRIDIDNDCTISVLCFFRSNPVDMAFSVDAEKADGISNVSCQCWLAACRGTHVGTWSWGTWPAGTMGLFSCTKV